MVVSINNRGPTFNNGEAGVLSTMVLNVGRTLACVVSLWLNGGDGRDNIGGCR